MSTQEGGASHDGFGALVSDTFPLSQSDRFARDLPHPCWVYRPVHPNKELGPRRPAADDFLRRDQTELTWVRPAYQEFGFQRV